MEKNVSACYRVEILEAFALWENVQTLEGLYSKTAEVRKEEAIRIADDPHDEREVFRIENGGGDVFWWSRTRKTWDHVKNNSPGVALTQEQEEAIDKASDLGAWVIVVTGAAACISVAIVVAAGVVGAVVRVFCMASGVCS